ncbi:hypothetical protein [Vineibacter terrae]|uniref:hypothetical protein n=1 Tax=Vineibacter terrae TaxID=2586908 RepID=UPI002E2F7A22|nr:hypothetical protein [Vineibacter terrae]HEX2892270.1 hypothetical protein [Vineibacter terrae]
MSKTGTGAGTASERAFRRYSAALARAQRREAEREAMYTEIRRVYGRGDDGAYLVQRVIDARRADARQAKAAVKVKAAAARAIDGRRTRDTIDMLYRRGQIDARQQLAALAYRQWWHDCYGSVPCALDPTRVRSGDVGSGSPTMAQLLGAEKMRQASSVLGSRDAGIVRAVVVDGNSIEEVAGSLFGQGKKAKMSDVRHTGQRLRLALEDLADVWSPQRRTGMRGNGGPRDEQSVRAGMVEPARVSHASLRGVRIT